MSTVLLRVGRTMTTNASSTTIRPSTSPLSAASRRNMLPRPPTTPSLTWRYRVWLRNLPHPLRDGPGRLGRTPHHGHYPRDHPLHKIQDCAEWEEVGDKTLIYANILRNIWIYQNICLSLQRERWNQVEPRCAERWHLRDDEQFDLAAWFHSHYNWPLGSPKSWRSVYILIYRLPLNSFLSVRRVAVMKFTSFTISRVQRYLFSFTFRYFLLIILRTHNYFRV